MRLTHIITGLETGGAEMMLLKLVRQSKRRIAHSVISLGSNGPVGELIAAQGVPIHSMNSRGPIAAISSIPRLRKTLVDTGPDVIQGWMYHGNIATSVATMLARIPCPTAWSIRCTIGNFKDELTASRTMIRTSALFSRRVRTVIYNSARAKFEHEAAGFRPQRSCVIPNGFDLDLFAPSSERRMYERDRLSIPPDQIVFGNVARLHPMKDPGNFIRAAVTIMSEVPDAIFVMIGRNVPALKVAFPELSSDVDRLGSRLLLLPEQSNTNNLLCALDAFVLTSAWGEGFSNALGEAMAMQLPCIATDVGDSADMLQEAGLIIPPRHPAQTAMAMRELVAMGKEGRAQLGTRARSRIAARYTMGTIGALYESEWRALLTEIG